MRKPMQENAIHAIEHIYIDGAFVRPHGVERLSLVDPTTEAVTGDVRLADEEDARRAVAAAKKALPAYSRTSKAERIAILTRLHDAVAAHTDRLDAAMIEEYGSPVARSKWCASLAAASFEEAAATLERYELKRRIRGSEVEMMPLGVVAAITPWNSNYGFICTKVSAAIAAGCTVVVKPSELSARQTQLLTECFDEAGVPRGVINIVTGRGDVVGDALTAHPDVAKISFTGSTAVGKTILRRAAETLKRVTLELGGKSPTLILDDAELAEAIPTALSVGFTNNGQACIAGTRILVHESRLADAIQRIQTAITDVKVGDPRDPATTLGPLVTKKQWERVQRYIRLGVEEGATLVTGGEGRPAGLAAGYFVKPTVFVGRNDMAIAREEIFGPVLTVIPYRSDEEAIQIANDTVYGLHAYVISPNLDRARNVASRLEAGRVAVNGFHHEPLAPFGGFKQSGIGREYGVAGLEAHLEPRTLLGLHAAA